MMAMSEAANIVGGRCFGEDKTFQGVSIDSRTVHGDDLFVAIPGEQFDGHDYVIGAVEKGASGAMVSTFLEQDIPQIVVSDTTEGLGVLGHQWRTRFDLPVVAITGSNGKTTVTNMVAAILCQVDHCLFPQNSFNNQWGVPLTLLKLREDHGFAVIEMGTNHHGEIEYLTRLTEPTIALINNVAAAHTEGLGDVEQIAKAKAEIFLGLRQNGIAVLNADDEFHPFWIDYIGSHCCEANIRSFSMNKDADMSLSELDLGQWNQSSFILSNQQESIPVQLKLAGKHNAMNALASATVCQALGVDLEIIKKGLESVHSVPGRLVLKQGYRNSIVVDDTYNANPESVMAGIDVLSQFDGKKILVLGAMAELGKQGQKLHFKVGSYAKKSGIDQLYCLEGGDRTGTGQYIEGFGDEARAFNNLECLSSDLKLHLHQGVAVLVKGSRSAKMERVVDAITDHDQGGFTGDTSSC